MTIYYSFYYFSNLRALNGHQQPLLLSSPEQAVQTVTIYRQGTLVTFYMVTAFLSGALKESDAKLLETRFLSHCFHCRFRARFLPSSSSLLIITLIMWSNLCSIDNLPRFSLRVFRVSFTARFCFSCSSDNHKSDWLSNGFYIVWIFLFRTCHISYIRLPSSFCLFFSLMTYLRFSHLAYILSSGRQIISNFHRSLLFSITSAVIWKILVIFPFLNNLSNELYSLSFTFPYITH